MPAALIMAGGCSARMRASRDARHKALVEVLGLSMLERNVLTLLSHGFDNIVVAISAQEKALITFARGRATRLAHAVGANLSVFVEEQPLGTIGAAKAIRARAENVLVVNVDNLSSLDLTALIAHHETSKAVMTIATHIEPFHVPFGQVSIRNGEIIEYREKPDLPVLLSSGTYVLGSAARQEIPPGRPVGIPELVHTLLRKGQRVSAFSHAAPWIDVNDAASVERAEFLLMANSPRFELWRVPPNRESVIAAVLKNGRVAFVKDAVSQLSGGKTVSRDPVFSSLGDLEDRIAHLRERIGLTLAKPQLLVSFDELELQTGQRTRYHILVSTAAAFQKSRSPVWRGGGRWMNVKELSRSHGNSRTIAYLERYIASQDPHSVGN